MADHSKIEWTDATWNIVTGCDIVSPGCTNCYAMKMAGTRLKNHQSRVGLTKPSRSGPVWTGEVRFNEKWLDHPLRWRKPRMIFVAAHGDLFHPGVPDEVLDKIFAVMALCPQHTFQCLTKRPERMQGYLAALIGDEDRCRDVIEASRKAGARLADLPDMRDRLVNLPLPNVWLGVSVEDQQRADERIPHLLATPAAKRFVSAEPLLGPVDLTNIDVYQWWHEGGDETVANALRGWLDTHGPRGTTRGSSPKLDWVIVGGESQAGARPMHPEWARSLRDQCTAAGVAFHFKQHGDWLHESQDPNRDWNWDAFDGTTDQFSWPDETWSIRLGKKAAGRLLDGRTHDEVPG